MACKQPIATYVATPTSSYTNKPVLDSMDTSLATMQLISLIEVGKTDRFPIIVVKHNSKVFGSTRILNAVDSHAWN